ncbi:MAG: aspartate/glutamate racemase family protein [Silicimonas sp.]|nr:aspartate/glutamate racemase family protein [Silicimonas sp.]
MTITIINPNSTEAMTEAMLACARAAAPDLSFDGWTSTEGPPAIQGVADGERAAPPLLDLVEKAGQGGASGIIIGCFDDTALAEANRSTPCPVIGIGQASYHLAALRGWRFSVVTTLAVSVPVIEENIRGGGLGHHLARVRASHVPVLDLERDPRAAETRILEESLRAEAEDGIDALILGCAGMVHVTRAVEDALSVPVIDPVVAAATAMRWLS